MLLVCLVGGGGNDGDKGSDDSLFPRMIDHVSNGSLRFLPGSLGARLTHVTIIITVTDHSSVIYDVINRY